MAKSKPSAPASPVPTGGNPFAGSSGSSGSSDSQAKHKAFLRYWSSLNGLYQQWLGRNATKAEATKYFSGGTGTSDYVIRQNIINSKDWLKSPMFRQQQQMYHYILGQFFGGGFKLTPKLVQTWTAHNYTQSDVQAYIYRHPHLYEQSNDFKDRVGAFHNTFQQVMGYDPSQITMDETRVVPATNTNKGKANGPPPPPTAPRPEVVAHYPTQSGGPGPTQPPPPPGSGGHGHGPGGGSGTGTGPQTTTTHVNEYEQHLRDAALHFQTTNQYADYLRSTHLYQQQLLSGGIKAQGSDAGLSLQQGVLTQQGLAHRPDLAS